MNVGVRLPECNSVLAYIQHIVQPPQCSVAPHADQQLQQPNRIAQQASQPLDTHYMHISPVLEIASVDAPGYKGLHVHTMLLSVVCFFPPPQLLASVGLDDYHTLNVWEWRKGKLVASTRGHSDRVRSCAQLNQLSTGVLCATLG